MKGREGREGGFVWWSLIGLKYGQHVGDVVRSHEASLQEQLGCGQLGMEEK